MQMVTVCCNVCRQLEQVPVENAMAFMSRLFPACFVLRLRGTCRSSLGPAQHTETTLRSRLYPKYEADTAHTNVPCWENLRSIGSAAYSSFYVQHSAEPMPDIAGGQQLSRSDVSTTGFMVDQSDRHAGQLPYTDVEIQDTLKLVQLIQAFRTRGHLVAQLDPLRRTRGGPWLGPVGDEYNR